jgi:carboxylate-amine ligase
MRGPSLTIGIEEEYQLVDPQNGKLHSYITQVLKEDHRVLREFEFKPRLEQSVVEIGTDVCRTAAEAAAKLIRIRLRSWQPNTSHSALTFTSPLKIVNS